MGGTLLAGKRKVKRSVEERNALVEQMLPVIRNVACMVVRRFPANIEIDDLVQQGCLGAMQAAERFDAALGIPFPAYAYMRIRGAMYDSVRRTKFTDIAMLSADSSDLTEDDDQVLYQDKAAEGVDEDSFIAAIDARRRLREVARAAKTLNTRQRRVVAIHYMEERTLREAGEEIGVSAPRAAQLRSEAITQIRSNLPGLKVA